MQQRRYFGLALGSIGAKIEGSRISMKIYRNVRESVSHRYMPFLGHKSAISRSYTRLKFRKMA